MLSSEGFRVLEQGKNRFEATDGSPRKAKAKAIGKAAVQNFIDNFKLYDTFANYWASWNAQLMLEHLREVHPGLGTSALEKEFGNLLRVASTSMLLIKLKGFKSRGCC